MEKQKNAAKGGPGKRGAQCYNSGQIKEIFA